MLYKLGGWLILMGLFSFFEGGGLLKNDVHALDFKPTISVRFLSEIRTMLQILAEE